MARNNAQDNGCQSGSMFAIEYNILLNKEILDLHTKIYQHALIISVCFGTTGEMHIIQCANLKSFRPETYFL